MSQKQAYIYRDYPKGNPPSRVKFYHHYKNTTMSITGQRVFEARCGAHFVEKEWGGTIPKVASDSRGVPSRIRTTLRVCPKCKEKS